MKLTKVVIKNYRSIKDMAIELNPSCRVLVGINESGKSNVLKALALLDEPRTTTSPDIRFPLEDESSIEEAFVRFTFALDEEEVSTIYENVLSKVLFKKTEEEMSIKKENLIIDLKSFCRVRSEGLYWVNVLKGTKSNNYWSLPKNMYAIEGEWLKPTSIVPVNFYIDVGNGNQALNEFSLVNKESIPDFSDVPAGYLQPATVEDVNKIIGEEIVKIVGTNLPDCVYWTYNEQNLLPASIALDSFAANPASCIPLKNMFELAGVENILEVVTAEKVRPNGIRNLLGRVAKHTTQHIRSVWKEYQAIEILLEPNGANIDASVREGFNRYDFASRSDGFKRFVSFLIMVSAKVKTHQLENTLLLIDEPEIGLHPSGARYLKNELIKISERNHVVYSTHSIFMVDKENIGRHLIIKKQNEVTVATEVTQSNFVDEEVIYNALGYSIFENLKDSNILFEGWRDKKLFQVAMENAPEPYKKLKSRFQKFGVAHLQGVKDAGRVCPILELASRRYFIVSDSDEVAKAEQKKFTGSFAGSGQWKRWDELSDEHEIVTGEDFIKAKHITSVLSKIKEQYPQLSGLATNLLNYSEGGGKLRCVEEWLGKTMTREEKRTFQNHLKDEVMNSLNHSHIEEYFYEYLQKLLEQVS